MSAIRCGGGGESPWLMVRPNRDREVGTVFRFWCCAKNETYSFFRNEHRKEQVTFDFIDAVEKVEVVGSSQGWLAMRDGTALFLLDPITHERVDLPPLDNGEKVHAVVLSSDQGGGKVFIISGQSQRLAFWSLHSHGICNWTILGNGYDSVVYSSTHRRLFCITSTTRLEGWDVGGDSPRLDNDWVVQFDSPPPPTTMQKQLRRCLVCAEEELFLVVPHVSTDLQDEDGFEVYKIDRDQQRLMKMEESLEGLAMFVGNNDGVAVRDVAGVKPDSVYFAYYRERGIFDYRRELGTFDYGRELGIFDYRKGLITPIFPSFFWFYPVWYTCRHHKY